MRITETQCAAFECAITPVLAGFQAKLYLYGSRVHDHLKGGDIDLLLVVPGTRIKVLYEHKYRILSEIKHHLGQQRIDLTISTQSDLENNAFLKTIYPTAVLLKEWN